MKAKRPFLEDGSQFGVSRTTFRRMRKAEKKELMISWFHQNFEDPAQHTSYISAEGGYLWNHGGPYEARDELHGQFGDLVSEALIEEVASELESDGIDEWAGTASHESEDDDYDPSPPDPFDRFSDEPTERYGSPEDRQTRERVLAALQVLRTVIEEPRPIGIGHNNPPEDPIETDAVEDLRSDVVALQTEFGKPNPSISLVKKLGAALRTVAIASIKWVGRKADLAVDSAIKTTVPLIVTGIGVTYNEPLHKAIDAIISWLTIVAHTAL